MVGTQGRAEDCDKTDEDWLSPAETHDEGIKRAFYAAAVSSSDDAIIGMALDTTIIGWNSGAETLYGYRAHDIVGRPFRILVPPDHIDEYNRSQSLLHTNGKRTAGEFIRITKSGERIRVSERTCLVRDAAGSLAGICATGRAFLSPQELRVSIDDRDQELRLALECGNLSTMRVDPFTHAIHSISAGGKSLLGLPSSADLPASLLEMVHIEDRDHLSKSMQHAADQLEPFVAEIRISCPGGEQRWINMHAQPIYGEQGHAIRLIAVIQDRTAGRLHELEQERALRLAEERADHDPLTSLLNHRAFHAVLEVETARSLRGTTTFAVVKLDLDNFEFFNDVYGHATGDEVLRLFAERLRTTCRPYDTIARFGGDEFCLILPSGEPATRQEIENRLRAALSDITYPSARQDTPIPIGVSMGVALFPGDTADRNELLRFADERLRLDKAGASGANEFLDMRAWALSHITGFPMLDAMVTAVTNKDRYTRQHSEDVMEFSLMIAKELGIGQKERDTIAVAAILHDIGKIGVPDSILRKPGALSDDEFEAIKQHPQMGAIIVSAVPGLEETLDAIRHHHERWDGNGYPFGLTAEETPLIARLMAVADAFSAMTSDRPYRKGMPHSKAISILQDGAGTQWDAVCVDALLRALSKGSYAASSAPQAV